MKSYQRPLFCIAMGVALVATLGINSSFAQDYVNAQVTWHKAFWIRKDVCWPGTTPRRI